MSTLLKVGDAVQWMVTKETRGGFSFGTSYGKIETICTERASASVKKRNGSTVTIALRRLIPRNQPSPVNHVFGALTEGRT